MVVSYNKLQHVTVDYGEKENHELADRFGLKKEDFPHYKLFVKGREEPYTFTGDAKKAVDVQKFVAEKSGKSRFIQFCWHNYIVIQ